MAVMRPSTPERPLPALSIEDSKVRVYGDAAVMTGSLVETNRDGRRELVLRFTNTYIKQKEQWRMVAGQIDYSVAGARHSQSRSQNLRRLCRAVSESSW